MDLLSIDVFAGLTGSDDYGGWSGEVRKGKKAGAYKKVVEGGTSAAPSGAATSEDELSEPEPEFTLEEALKTWRVWFYLGGICF